MFRQGILGVLQLPLTYIQQMGEKAYIGEIDPRTISVAVFCALSYEAVAVKYCLDEEFTCPITIGPKNYVYSFGRIGNHRLVIAQPLHMGVVKAAQCAAAVRQQFPNVKFALMVGIGAGIPSPKRDIRLGDIAVGIPGEDHPGILEYDFCKYEQDRYVQKGCANKPPSLLVSADGSLEEDEIMNRSPLGDNLRDITTRPGFARPKADDILYDENFAHVNKGLDCTGCEQSVLKRRVPRDLRSWNQPVVHRGLILSGNGVIKNPRDRYRLQRGHNAICFEMEAAGITDEIPCLVVRGICDYADTHKQDGWHYFAAAAAAAYCKTILLKIDTPTVEVADYLGFLLSGRFEGLKAAWAMIQSGFHDGNNLNLAKWIDLNRLPIAEDAMFDSYVNQHESLCLPGSRAEIISCIEDWIDDACGNCIFHLNGKAGTGKSTIARTIAKRCQEKRLLGASFFFKRDAGVREHGRRFVSTIARQLLVNFPQLLPSVRKALDKSPDITTKSLAVQFEKLISQPLLNLLGSQKNVLTLVIVIDALDECEPDNDVQLILHLLSQLGNSDVVRPRIFIASRPELPVRLGFKNIAHHELVLEDTSSLIIQQDISLFLTRRLMEIRDNRALPHDWPREVDFQSLVTLSVPSFAFAAAVCNSLEDPQWDPQDRLTDILRRRPDFKLDGTYLPVLQQLLRSQTEAQKEQLVREFKEITGHMILLKSPLPVTALSNLLGRSKKLIYLRINSLYSVINVPTDESMPVELFHWSFQDILLSPEASKKTPFWIDEKETHRNLSIQCLKVIRRTLEQYDTHQVETHASTGNHNLNPEIEYACRCWAYHQLRSTDFPLKLDDHFQMLKEHFSHWMGVPSTSDPADDVMDLIHLLLSANDVQNHDLPKFLNDVKQSFQSILEKRQLADDERLQLCFSENFDEVDGSRATAEHTFCETDQRLS